MVSRAGAVLLVESVRKSGLDTAISAAPAPWRRPQAVHDPGKILLDVALAVALGGDCLANVAMLRAEPAVFGPVACDPTVSRLMDKLASGGERALVAIRMARAEVREHVRRLAGEAAPDADGQVIVDLDGVLVLAHSEKQDATATWKKTFGHHPLTGFVDHGRGGSGEPDGEVRDGAWVTELAGDCLTGWPKGLRLIVREERPHPGAQLRFADADGMRLTRFATNTIHTPIAELELRHRQRARAEDRIRAARATGLRNLPLRDAAQNQIWLEIVQIALDLPAWMPMLAMTGNARLWEPRRLRLRLFSAAAQLVSTGRRRIPRLAKHWPWTDVITDAPDRLHALPNPG
ncbi:transposase [Streptomyces sp. CB02923]|nr:transposase [Streptomyces sp. CB02923]